MPSYSPHPTTVPTNTQTDLQRRQLASTDVILRNYHRYDALMIRARVISAINIKNSQPLLANW